jgi:hypothetical protein
MAVSSDGSSSLNTLLHRLDNQPSAVLQLLIFSTGTQSAEMLIQSAVSDVLEKWSEGASNSISGGDAILNQQTAHIQGLTGTGTATQIAVQKAMGQYQTDQTEVSLKNNLYSSVMDGGTTCETNLTQVQSQELQFATAVLENLGNVAQLIMGWAS